MSNAQHLVDVLLEAVRACAQCQKDHGIVPDPDTSHGMCRRHAFAYFQEMLAALGPSPRLEQQLIDIKARPDDYFSPDLGERVTETAEDEVDPKDYVQSGYWLVWRAGGVTDSYFYVLRNNNKGSLIGHLFWVCVRGPNRGEAHRYRELADGTCAIDLEEVEHADYATPEEIRELGLDDMVENNKDSSGPVRTARVVENAEDEVDPKDYVPSHAAMLDYRLADLGIPLDRVDGIEVYGVSVSPGGDEERVSAGEAASYYGVSLHVDRDGIDFGGLHDVGDYATPTEARGIALKLHARFPKAHFIDEINEAAREKIASCAARLRSGEILTGPIHAQIINQAIASGLLGDVEEDEEVRAAMRKVGWVNGFVTDAGRFVDRREAYKIARASTQVDAVPGGRLFHTDFNPQ